MQHIICNVPVFIQFSYVDLKIQLNSYNTILVKIYMDIKTLYFTTVTRKYGNRISKIKLPPSCILNTSILI